MKKKVKVAFMIMTICMMFINNIVAFANEAEKKIVKEEKIEKINKFEKAKKKEFTKKKVKEEKAHTTNIMDEEKENYLNDAGVFDNEICKMDENTLNEINENDVNDIKVSTSFYEYNEIIEESNKQVDYETIDETKLKEIDEEQINEVIAEVYYNTNIEEKDEKNSIVDKTLEALGIKPINTYASENTYVYYDPNKSYMKRSILIVPTKVNGIQYYKILCTYEWLTMPLNRLVDVPSIIFDANMKYNNNNFAKGGTSAKVVTVYTVSEYRELTGELLSMKTNTQEEILRNKYYIENGDEKITLEVGELGISNHKLHACVDLMNDDTVAYSYERKVVKTEVEYISVIICTYAVRESMQDENTTIEYGYAHTKSKQLLDIKALSFSSGDKKLDAALFILRNTNCIKFSSYTVKEAGSEKAFEYTYK